MKKFNSISVTSRKSTGKVAPLWWILSNQEKAESQSVETLQSNMSQKRSMTRVITQLQSAKNKIRRNFKKHSKKSKWKMINPLLL